MKKKRIVQALLAVALLVILSIWGFENPFRKNTVEESKWWLEFEEDVMSIVLKNDSDKDLQYAVVKLDYGQEVASFAVTNLKAGAKAIVLEQDRMAAKDDQLRISGQKQTLNVKNISGGFAIDEIKQIPTSHYIPKKCEIVLVDIVEQM